MMKKKLERDLSISTSMVNKSKGEEGREFKAQ